MPFACAVGSRILFPVTQSDTGTELWAFDTRTPTDCNQNGINDFAEIAQGTAFDANHDGVIDDCQCLADWSGGGVSVQDIFDFLNDWFTSNADFNHSGNTEIQDIFDFLNAWFIGC